MISKRHQAVIALIGLILIALSVSPFVIAGYIFAKSSRDSKNRVQQLDYVAIRDAGQSFIAEMNSTTGGMIRVDELPDVISKTNPNFAHFSNQVLFVEYGGGFTHFGLAIPTPGIDYHEGTRLAEGVYFYDRE